MLQERQDRVTYFWCRRLHQTLRLLASDSRAKGTRTSRPGFIRFAGSLVNWLSERAQLLRRRCDEQLYGL